MSSVVFDLPLLLQMTETYARVGKLLERNGKFKDAEKFFRKVLKIEEAAHLMDDALNPGIAAACNNLGNLLSLKGELKKAESFLVRALEIRQRCHGLAHPSVATAMSNLGTFFSEHEMWQQAEMYYRAALAVDEEVNSSTVLLSMCSCALLTATLFKLPFCLGPMIRSQFCLGLAFAPMI